MTQAAPPVQVDVVTNLEAVRTQLVVAARNCGRDPDEITLVAVSKFHGPERITPALGAQQLVFGENRVQEAAAKWPALRETTPNVNLRLIGPLQTNKVRQAVALFDAIETLDRPKLARKLADEIVASGNCPELFVQVNIGEESQKAGIAPGDVDGFIDQCRREFGLQITGLMCIPPDRQDSAPYFELLAKIAAGNGIDRLSMGMSADFEIAIALGATHVRVGTAIFGTRA